MTTFRTILSPQKATISIDYHTPILCVGSCFTQNVGQLLIDYKFPALLNPFGILYNPISIKHSLDRLLTGIKYEPDDLFFHQDLWYSFDHHGVFAHPNQSTALAKINGALSKASHFLTTTKRLMITLGTANVFVYQQTQKIVANCHKVPTNKFVKKRLSVSEVVSSLTPILTELKIKNPALAIIFTVSPIRHLKDGIIESQRSKATLLLAVEQLAKNLPFVHYFPAYELVLDDLRDYRFYEKDMAHPNGQAIQYIWDFFRQTYFSEQTALIFKKVKKIVQASQHRPFHAITPTHQQFVRQQLENISAMEKQYPFLTLKRERAIFRAQLNS
ncbi:MAG: GSCFA domain-containing protein [Bacteroidota bacterium]